MVEPVALVVLVALLVLVALVELVALALAVLVVELVLSWLPVGRFSDDWLLDLIQLGGLRPLPWELW